MRAPREIVERFIEEHKEWILKKRCEWGMNKAVDSSKILPAVGRKEGKQKIKKLIEERVAYYARIMGRCCGGGISQKTCRNQNQLIINHFRELKL